MFYQEKPSDEILNCDQEGILGTTASIVGSLQANEIIKIILSSKNNLNNSILILNTLNLKLRIIKFKKLKNVYAIYNCFYYLFTINFH